MSKSDVVAVTPAVIDNNWSDLVAAADAIESLGRLYRHMERAGAALRSVASAANAEQEYRGRAQAVLAQVGLHEEKLAAANEAVIAAEVERDRVLSEGREAVAALKANAEAEAATIIGTAQQRARCIAEDAEAAQASREEGCRKRLTEIGEQVAARAQEIERLNAEVAAKLEALSELDDRIAQARQAAASIIGSTT